MKKLYKWNLFLGAVILFAASCRTPQPLAGKFKDEWQKGRENNADVFVVKNDGKKIAGKKLDFSNQYAYKYKAEMEWIAVDGKKINYGQYNTIQTPEAYKMLYDPQIPEVYPYGIYACRIRSGKIDLYEYQPLVALDYREKKYPYHEYVFQKDNEKPEALNYATFANAISDNQEVLAKFKELFPSGIISKKNIQETLSHITEVADLYNRSAGPLKEF
jgi:hypothetical protein